MKILVIGGTGFSGKALVKNLLHEGHEVVALDYKKDLKTEERCDSGATVGIGNVADKDVVARGRAGIDVVHHLAAAFRELNLPDTYYYDVNVNGTRNVLGAALANGVQKFVYCSTCGVHAAIASIASGSSGLKARGRKP